MKPTSLLSTFLALLCISSLTLPAQAGLHVNFGYLGLNLVPGETNHIWASPPDANSVFDHWSGFTDSLADSHSWHTTGVVPSGGGSVTAVYKAAPAWTPITVEAGQSTKSSAMLNMMYYFPSNPLGIIFFFHGSGGSASSFFENVETLAFAREAVAAGYAVVTLDSNDRLTRSWDKLYDDANVDVVNVKKAIQYFIRQKLMTSETPRYSTGMSDGGAFSPKPAYFLGFQGNGIWCAGGVPGEIFRATTVPTIWSLARNDDLYEHTTFWDSATTHQRQLTDRGIDAELQPEHLPSPLYPQRFMRIPGVLLPDSQTIFDLLKSGGYLTSKNYLRENPDSTGWASLLPKELKKYRKDISDQLSCCYSGHKFFSEYDSNVLAFFAAHR